MGRSGRTKYAPLNPSTRRGSGGETSKTGYVLKRAFVVALCGYTLYSGLMAMEAYKNAGQGYDSGKIARAKCNKNNEIGPCSAVPGAVLGTAMAKSFGYAKLDNNAPAPQK